LTNEASVVLAAIADVKAAIRRGQSIEVRVDTEAFTELDELDEAAIRAFFSEPE